MTTDRTAIRRRLAVRRTAAPSTMARAEVSARLHCRAAGGNDRRDDRSRRRASRSRAPAASAWPSAPRRRERQLGLLPGEPLGDGLRRMALGQVDLCDRAARRATAASPTSGACTRRARRSSACGRCADARTTSSARTPTPARTPPCATSPGGSSGARDAEVMLARSTRSSSVTRASCERRGGVRRAAPAPRRRARRMRAPLARRGRPCEPPRSMTARVSRRAWPRGSCRDGDEHRRSSSPACGRLYEQGRRRYRRAAQRQAATQPPCTSGANG